MFTNASTRQINLGLALLRVVIGIIFIAHGGQKLFVFGMDGVAGAFGQMGVPMAALAGPAVALLEFFGGMALVAGVLTRLVAIGLAITMAGAITFVHAKAGFFAPNGYEFVLALLSAVLTLALTGAGSYSIDGLIARRSSHATPQSSVRIGTRRAA